jgi:Tfp pilus assembly protein PilF
MMIDGDRDLRAIAGSLGSSEFEIAKIAYGLVSTGVVELRAGERHSPGSIAAIEGIEATIALSREALAGGRFEDALATTRDVLVNDPRSTDARLIAARALSRLSRHQDAVDELRRAVQADPITPEVHLDLAFASVRVGDFATAHSSGEHFLRLAPSSPQVGLVRAALETLTRLQHVLEAHADV